MGGTGVHWLTDDTSCASKGASVRVYVSFDKQQGEELQRRADEQGLSLGTLLRWLGLVWLSKEQRKEQREAARNEGNGE